MFQRISAIMACSFLALGAIGCGGPAPAKLIPVSGKITVNQMPLETGNVVFVPEGPGEEARGAIEAGGVYRLKTGDREGCAAGKYRVQVFAMKNTDSTQPPVWLANQKYASGNSGLNAEVKAEKTGGYDFDLMP